MFEDSEVSTQQLNKRGMQMYVQRQQTTTEKQSKPVFIISRKCKALLSCPSSLSGGNSNHEIITPSFFLSHFCFTPQLSWQIFHY